MQATMEGSKVNITNKNQTMIVLPNQFRSEIQYEGKKYLVVSDGITTWIYDHQKNKYASMSAEQFQASEDSILVGLSSSFLLEIVRSFLTNQEKDEAPMNIFIRADQALYEAKAMGRNLVRANPSEVSA